MRQLVSRAEGKLEDADRNKTKSSNNLRSEFGRRKPMAFHWLIRKPTFQPNQFKSRKETYEFNSLPNPNFRDVAVAESMGNYPARAQYHAGFAVLHDFGPTTP